MKLYKTTLIPESNFATPLKGDTLFGQMCWSIRHLLGEEKLKELLFDYETSPFLVVSDGFASGYLPKPKLPRAFLGENPDEKKANRKKNWLRLEDLQHGNFSNAIEVTKDKTFTVMRNSINYKTFSTDDSGAFSPYGVDEMHIEPKDVYCLIDEERFALDALSHVFDFLRNHGYGKDTTIGKGRFAFESFEAVDVGKSTTTVMALSPFCPEGLVCEKLYYEPFTRFGKKGGDRAHQNPFKKPLLLADTASVIRFAQPLQSLFVGKAILGHSTHSDIVHQGYAIALPIKELL